MTQEMPAPAAALFEMLASVVAPNTALYVAGPIGSGLEYARDSSADPHALRKSFRERLAAHASTLRQRRTEPVIDSGVLQEPPWSDADYGRFFIEVMLHFASEVHLVEGWEYSIGATKEVVVALGAGLRCFDRHGARLDAASCASAVRAAASHVVALKGDGGKLSERARALDALV